MGNNKRAVSASSSDSGGGEREPEPAETKNERSPRPRKRRVSKKRAKRSREPSRKSRKTESSSDDNSDQEELDNSNFKRVTRSAQSKVPLFPLSLNRGNMCESSDEDVNAPVEDLEIEEDSSEDEIDIDDIVVQEYVKNDLNKWKLDELFEKLGKLKDYMSQSRGAKPRILFSVLQPRLHEMDNIFAATEVPSPMSYRDHFLKLDPPTNSSNYNEAMKLIDVQVTKRTNHFVKIICPAQDCNYKYHSVANMRRHVQQKHFKLQLWKCGNPDCGKLYRSLQCLENHVKEVHFDMKEDCKTCLQRNVGVATRMRHTQFGHVTPTGKMVFVCLDPNFPRQINYNIFVDKYITAPWGFTFQVIAIPWENKQGGIVDISIGITRFADLVAVVSRLWNEIKSFCDMLDNPNSQTAQQRKEWVRGCGSARKEVQKGHVMKPELAFSLELYIVSYSVACQVKWYSRLYYDSVKVMATNESKFYLDVHSDKLKTQLNSMLTHPNMPKKNREYVKKNGPGFKFTNV